MNLKFFKTIPAGRHATAPGLVSPLLKAGLCACSLLLSGCIDDNYDLSDIDTTSKFSFNDLTLPLNLDPVTLDNIIKIDDDSQIKIVNFNGQDIYAVSVTGEFSSDPIKVERFTSDLPVTSDSRSSFKLISDNDNLTYTIDNVELQDINIHARNISSSIQSLTEMTMKPTKLDITLTATSQTGSMNMRFISLTIDFIKGLTLSNLPSNYSYDPRSGRLIISNLDCTGNVALISVTATAINLTQAGMKFNAAAHEAILDTQVTIKDARIKASANPYHLETIDFIMHTDINPFEATSISGELKYDLTGDELNINPVDLTDIPDFLSGEQTNILLTNPQIYIQMNNPMASTGLKVGSGLELVANRGSKHESYTLDPGQTMMMNNAYGSGPYNFVLSPQMPRTPLAEFNNHLQHVGFGSLADVLSGKGLPQTIDIKLIDPGLPLQTVTNFELGKDYSNVKGRYEFFAPLALRGGENGTVIVYSKRQDGWSDDELDKLSITSLTIEALATSTIPLSAELRVIPLDNEGNRIPDITVTPATLAAQAVDAPLSITVEGDIRHLDGILIEAVARPGSEQTLTPSQTITLKNLKAKATGSYTTDF